MKKALTGADIVVIPAGIPRTHNNQSKSKPAPTDRHDGQASLV